MSFTLLIHRFVFISDLPYTGRFDFVQVLQEKDEAMNYSSDEDDIDEDAFDVSRFDIITRQVVATISIKGPDDCVPKFYLLGIDMKEHKKTVEESLLPFPMLVHDIRYPTRRCRLHINASLFPSEEMFRATCVVPVGGVISKPMPLHETRLQQQLPSAQCYWSFPLTYSDRNNWNTFTATQLAQRLHNLQGEAGAGLGREGAVGGGDDDEDFIQDFEQDFAMFERNINENDSAEDEEDEEDDHI
jgi:hypothetical protein